MPLALAPPGAQEGSTIRNNQTGQTAVVRNGYLYAS
jgi:hypothetical protein